MIPILYESTETTFRSNGLGRLSDCIRCIVTEERNGLYECEFDYPVSGSLFNEIEEGKIIACTHDEQGDIQPFDIYGRSEPINGVVTFYAHHISYRLNEITVYPFTATSCAEALAKIGAYSINTNPFTFWTNKSTEGAYSIAAPRNAKDMLVGSEGSILDIYGTGEYEYDKFDIKLYAHRGQDTNVSIRYGKNLIDYRNEFDVSQSYTGVVPYWLGDVTEGEETSSELVMLPEIYITSGHSVPSGREVLIPMDLSSDFQSPPSIELLRNYAASKLASSDGWLPSQTVTVNFVQLWQTEEYEEYAVLQRLSLCDTCGIFVPMYGTSLRAKVIRVVYNVLLDRYDEMDLGDKPITYAAVLEQQYDSKVAGVIAGLQAIAVDIGTVQEIAAADATAKANAAKLYSDQKLADAVLDINADIADLQDQIDGNITTWFLPVNPTLNNPPVAYDPNVPGSGWDTDAKKNEHLGDLYYNTTSGDAWRFIYEDGAFFWLAISDTDIQEALRLASEAKDIADSKRRIFYTQPVPPYDDGDLWTQGANGDILRCAVPKAADETYDETDWILASKYTDNSALYAFVSGTFADTVSDIEDQLDLKAETWYQAENPAINWITEEQRELHTGDLWYYTGQTTTTYSQHTTYRWDGEEWQVQTIPSSVFDMIDGKSQIFVGATTPSGAENGDLWFKGPDEPILTYVNGMWVDYNYYIDSSVSQGQADMAEAAAKSYAQAAVESMRSDLETQIDAKIETWTQTSDPQTSWTDRAAHDKDLWLYTGLSQIVVNGQLIRPQGVYIYTAIAGGTLCNENNVDITDENGVILETNDIGTWSPYASTSNNLFDFADGKTTIYYGSTSGSYPDKEAGDYLVDSSTGSSYRWNGSSWVKVTDYQTYTNNQIASAKLTIEQQYEQAIEDATEQIRGGTGGYIVTTVNANGQPIELLITDNLNLNQARNVWRWNQGGLAHSSNGYNGPFSDVAITADGKINASRILTGALTANLITAGTIIDASGRNSWNLESGQFTTKQGTIANMIIDNAGISYSSSQSTFSSHFRIDYGSLEVRELYGTFAKGLAITGLNGISFYYMDSLPSNPWDTMTKAGYITPMFGGLTLHANNGAYIDLDDEVTMNSLFIFGSMSATGHKNRIMNTENYGDRLLYCYETPTPLFGDIGEAVLGEDGLCYVEIDDILSETIADKVEYQVFLQKEGSGDCWVSEKNSRYFVIEGTPNLKVAWELKAKQKDYNINRLEQFGIGLDEYVNVKDQDIFDNYIKEQEDILYGYN